MSRDERRRGGGSGRSETTPGGTESADLGLAPARRTLTKTPPGLGGRRRSSAGIAPGRRTLTKKLALQRKQARPRKRRAGPGAPDAAGDPGAIAARGTTDPGGPLPYEERIQRAFGRHDIDDVRAHEGGAATEANEALGANAYAVGDDVAFKGSPDLHTAAHEAAHVIQQREGVKLKGGVGEQGDAYERHADAVADAVVAGRSAEPLLDAIPSSGGKSGVQHRANRSGGTVQRLRDDLRVTGAFEPDEDDAPDWEDHVFFDLANAELSGQQKQRIADFVATLPPGPRSGLTLVGHSSEEGVDAVNTRLANARIDAVASELVGAHGFADAQLRRDPRPQASGGRIAYRRWRAVQMHTAAPQTPDCSVAPETKPFTPEQRGYFNEALAQAQGWIATAASELGKHSPPPDLPPEVERLFGRGVALDDVKQGVADIQAQVSGFSSNPPIVGTECHDNCQGGMIAFVKGGTEMTLCPAFFGLETINDAARALVHEAAHFDAGVDAGDHAYGWERLIEHLPAADALDNADSFALLIMRIAGHRLDESHRPTNDDVSGLGNPEHEEKAEQAIAYLQRWITATIVIMNHLYAEVNRALDSDSHADWPSDFVRDKLRLTARELRFRAPHRPSEEDKAILAGIYDRFRTMGVALRETSLSMTTARGNSEWEPGPGARLAINPTLWDRSPRGRIRLLLRRLATATPDIPRGLVGGYVNIADDFRQVQGNGP